MRWAGRKCYLPETLHPDKSCFSLSASRSSVPQFPLRDSPMVASPFTRAGKDGRRTGGGAVCVCQQDSKTSTSRTAGRARRTNGDAAAVCMCLCVCMCVCGGDLLSRDNMNVEQAQNGCLVEKRVERQTERYRQSDWQYSHTSMSSHFLIQANPPISSLPLLGLSRLQQHCDTMEDCFPCFTQYFFFSLLTSRSVWSALSQAPSLSQRVLQFHPRSKPQTEPWLATEVLSVQTQANVVSTVCIWESCQLSVYHNVVGCSMTGCWLLINIHSHSCWIC